ncbi:hypothetical protein EV702DRAFT_1279028, partial [Suillus placidus]
MPPPTVQDMSLLAACLEGFTAAHLFNHNSAAPCWNLVETIPEWQAILGGVCLGDFYETDLAPHLVVDGWPEQAMEGLAGVAKAEWCEHSRYNAASNVVSFLIRKHGRK